MMKRHLFFPILSLFFLLAFTTRPEKQRIVFFGDSITQAGVGPKGYVTVLGQLLSAKNKADQYDLLGAGISGNKVTDLYLRLEDDVLPKDPSIVVIWIGVNDVWHKRGGTGTDTGAFDRFYTAIIKKLQAKNIRVILCTPAAIGEKTDHSNELDGGLNQYANIIRSLATKNNCELVDLRKAFIGYNLLNNKDNKDRGILTSDGVHLNDAGNQFVAEEMLKLLVKE